MNRKITCIVLAVSLVGLAAGCASYYKVTDPATSKVYYTNDLDRHGSGSVVFKDAITGSTITLQSSNIAEINKQEYKANTPYH